MKAEHLAEVDQLTQLMRTAANYGFAIADGAGWRLLPAVFRYLDRFEELAHRDATGEADASDAELGDDIAVEEDDA